MPGLDVAELFYREVVRPVKWVRFANQGLSFTMLSPVMGRFCSLA